MLETIFFVCLLSTMLSIKMHKSINNSLALFMSLWMLILLTYIFNILNLYEVSQITNLSLLIMITSFALGHIIGIPRTNNIKYIEYHKTNTTYSKLAKIMWAMPIIGWIAVIIFIQNNTVDLSLSSQFERLDPKYTNFTGLEREFIQKIGIPFLANGFLFSMALRARLLNQKTRSPNINDEMLAKNFGYISLLCAIGLIAFDLATLKRMQIINIFAAIISTNIFTTKAFRFKFKHIPIYASTITLFILAITWVTSSREIYINGSLYLSWVLYFAGPLAYFDNFIKSAYFTPNQYGLSSFMGIIGYGLTPLATVFGVPESLNFYFDRQESILIGTHQEFNAFGTMMLDGYYDFGVFGIFALSLFSGFITSKFTNIAKYSDSPFYVCLSAMSFCWIIFFPIGWTGGMQFAFGQAPISILILYIMTKLKK